MKCHLPAQVVSDEPDSLDHDGGWVTRKKDFQLTASTIPSVNLKSFGDERTDGFHGFRFSFPAGVHRFIPIKETFSFIRVKTVIGAIHQDISLLTQLGCLRGKQRFLRFLV